MPILAGGIVTAGQLGRMQPTTYGAVATSSTAAMVDTTQTDIPGATIDVVTAAANAVYTVTGVFDVLPATTSTSVLVFGFLDVDGAVDSGVAIHGLNTVTRETITQVWRGTLTAAGAHTLKLTAALSGALALGASVRAQNSKIQVTITEVV